MGCCCFRDKTDELSLDVFVPAIAEAAEIAAASGVAVPLQGEGIVGEDAAKVDKPGDGPLAANMQEAVLDEDEKDDVEQTVGSVTEVGAKEELPDAGPLAVSMPEAVNDTGHTVGPEKTMIFVDWDDTIMPSSWLRDVGVLNGLWGRRLPNEKEQRELNVLAGAVRRSISMLKKYGDVVIMTNAETGWMEWTMHHFMPTLTAALADVRKVSARSTFEHQSAEANDWKRLAFDAEVSSVFGAAKHSAEVAKHIVSIGDGDYERSAAIDTAASTPTCRYKWFGFMPDPDLEALVSQHQTLQEDFDVLHATAGSFETTTWDEVDDEETFDGASGLGAGVELPDGGPVAASKLERVQEEDEEEEEEQIYEESPCKAEH